MLYFVSCFVGCSTIRLDICEYHIKNRFYRLLVDGSFSLEFPFQFGVCFGAAVLKCYQCN